MNNNTNNTVDLLQIKIEKAKRELPLETINAINSVDWRKAISDLRIKRKYNLEQLSDLELETELVLCGLVDPEEYPKELEASMRISKADLNELLNYMNDMVFKKIREVLIKNTTRKKEAEKKEVVEEKMKDDVKILNSAGIKIAPEHKTEWQTNNNNLPILEKLELNTTKPVENRESLLKAIENPQNVHPLLSQKLSAPIKVATVENEHSLPNLKSLSENEKNQQNKIDPYREMPE